MIDLIILAGGFGTRLKSISDGIPKALMPIGDSVYLDLLLDKVFEYNIDNVFLSLHYGSKLFLNYINHSKYKNQLIPVIEPKPLGTGGAINYVIENSRVSSPFFVINGDSLSTTDLDQMFTEFDNSNYKAMVGISKVENSQRYGTVVEKDGEVLSFNEKGVRGTGWINNGHYIFNKEVFEKYGNIFSLEKNLFLKLAKNKKLGAFKVHNDNFIDIGTPEDYQKTAGIYGNKIKNEIVSNVFEIPIDTINQSTSPENVEKWDSLGQLALISAIEQEFKITLEINEMFEIMSVGDIYKILERKGVK